MHERKTCGVVASAAFALTLAGAGIAIPASAAEGDSNQVTISVAAISDFHGHIENASQLQAELLKQKEANPNFLFVGNGDLVGGSAYVSSIAKDQPTIEILGKMGLSLSGSGNHEFDQGQKDFLERIVPAAKTAGFDYTLASVDGMNLPTYLVREVSGVKVAFVSGVTDELSTLVSPTGITGLTINDPIAAINKVAAQLKDGDESNGEADIVVALSHATIAKSAQLSADVDAGVAGHTHHQESLTTASGAPVLEVGEYGNSFGKYTFVYDQVEKKLVSVNAENVTLNLAERAADGTLPETAIYNPEIENLYLDALKTAETLGADKVGEIDGEANRGTNDGAETGGNRGTESSLGNLIAEGFYQYSQGMETKADFAIMNPGGLRADLDPNRDGIVTVGESYSVQPFGNSFATASYTGDQIYTMLEQQWNPDPEADRPLLRLGLSKNLKYIYDPTAPYGKHVLAVFLNDAPIDRAKTYTIASNQFLLAGGDGFTVLADTKTYKDTGLIDNDVFNAYLQGAGGAVKVDYTQRSFGVTGLQQFKPGEKVELQLSSLVMTSTEPKPSKVTVRLGDVTVAADIETSVVPNLDEAGKATVSFIVPANLAGKKVLLEISTDDGSAVALPVTVAKVLLPSSENLVLGSGGAASDLASGSGNNENVTEDNQKNAAGSGDVKAEKTENDKADGKLSDTGAGVAQTLLLAAVLLGLGGATVAARRKFTV